MMQSKSMKFDGKEYFDDRLFVLHVCPGIVEIQLDGVAITTIFLDKPPAEHLWCVVTYRNCNRYPLHRVDSFYKKEDAEAYITKIEPETPLISLGGHSPIHPLSYEQYVLWKKENDFKDYEFESLYTPGRVSASEQVFQTKEQFQGIQ